MAKPIILCDTAGMTNDRCWNAVCMVRKEIFPILWEEVM